jgi:hypothetical protein
MATMGDVLEWAGKQNVSQVPKADLDQRNPDYIHDQLLLTLLPASLYFRADVRCRDRIPAKGPVVLVGCQQFGHPSSLDAKMVRAAVSFTGQVIRLSLPASRQRANVS